MRQARRHAVTGLTAWVDPFTAWFVSKGGVAQTSIVVLATVVLELTGVIRDPNALYLMAVLTVYSAITQPALAYATQLGSEQQEKILREQDKMLDMLAHMMRDDDAILLDVTETLDEIQGHLQPETLSDIYKRLKEAGYD